MVIFAHTKIAALILGGIEIFWAALALGPADSLFVKYLRYEDAEAEWAFILFANGLLLVLSCLFPWRSMRHIGLALCCFVMFAFGGYFFSWGLFTPVTVLMPYLGLMSLITLMAEVKAKPRTGKKDVCP